MSASQFELKIGIYPDDGRRRTEFQLLLVNDSKTLLDGWERVTKKVLDSRLFRARWVMIWEPSKLESLFRQSELSFVPDAAFIDLNLSDSSQEPGREYEGAELAIRIRAAAPPHVRPRLYVVTKHRDKPPDDIVRRLRLSEAAIDIAVVRAEDLQARLEEFLNSLDEPAPELNPARFETLITAEDHLAARQYLETFAVSRDATDRPFLAASVAIRRDLLKQVDAAVRASTADPIKGNILVTGPAGSGKEFMPGWIADRRHKLDPTFLPEVHPVNLSPESRTLNDQIFGACVMGGLDYSAGQRRGQQDQDGVLIHGHKRVLYWPECQSLVGTEVWDRVLEFLSSRRFSKVAGRPNCATRTSADERVQGRVNGNHVNISIDTIVVLATDRETFLDDIRAERRGSAALDRRVQELRIPSFGERPEDALLVFAWEVLASPRIRGIEAVVFRRLLEQKWEIDDRPFMEGTDIRNLAQMASVGAIDRGGWLSDAAYVTALDAMGLGATLTVAVGSPTVDVPTVSAPLEPASLGRLDTVVKDPGGVQIAAVDAWRRWARDGSRVLHAAGTGSVEERAERLRSTLEKTLSTTEPPDRAAAAYPASLFYPGDGVLCALVGLLGAGSWQKLGSALASSDSELNEAIVKPIGSLKQKVVRRAQKIRSEVRTLVKQLWSGLVDETGIWPMFAVDGYVWDDVRNGWFLYECDDSHRITCVILAGTPVKDTSGRNRRGTIERAWSTRIDASGALELSELRETKVARPPW